jgi:hypothetical protein
LYATTRGTITAANAAGVPLTTTANTANDSYVSDVIAKFTALTQAKKTTADADQAVISAQQAASTPQTPAQIADIANKQVLAGNALTAQGTAQTNYNNARNALININLRSYTVTTTTIIPGTPPTSVTTTTTGFIDNRPAITAQITTYEEKYTAYSVAALGVTLAQDGYNKAVVAEAGAKDAYDQLVATNTTIGTTAGGPGTPWAGAEAILQAADAKGGMR